MKKIIPLLLINLVLSTHAFAANTITATTQASAKLSSICSLTANNLDFGTLTSGVTTKVSSSISVLCTKSTPYSVSMSYPINLGSGYMTSSTSSDQVSFNIYSDTGYGTNAIWNTNSYNYVLNAIGTGATQTYMTYGATQAGYVTPGVYSATVNVIVSY